MYAYEFSTFVRVFGRIRGGWASIYIESLQRAVDLKHPMPTLMTIKLVGLQRAVDPLALMLTDNGNILYLTVRLNYTYVFTVSKSSTSRMYILVHC